MTGPKAEMQFRYWDLGRRGATQSQIAREFRISRQSVNKSVKLHEREVMYRLLETARTTGTLVEWSDAGRGVLIGVTPQLGNLPCLILLDDRNRVKVFHDQTNNPQRDAARATTAELRNSIRSSLGIDISGEVTFETILRTVYEG